MAISVKKLVRRHGAGVAAVTALGVGALLLAQHLGLAAIQGIDPSPFDSSFVWLANQPPLMAFVEPALELALSYSAFVVGIFLSLWIVGPIAEELRVGHVIARSVLATGIGATLWFAVIAVAGIALLARPNMNLGGLGQSIPVQLGYALEHALSGFVALLPLGVLAGVLLWLWRKDHAPKHPLSGLIDEV